jgi:hypothetical protein
VKIVQIRSKAQPLNRTIDVFLDMFGRVGDTSFFENCKAALGGDKNFVADVVLADEVAEHFLVHACGVDGGGVPEGAAEFDGLQEDWLGFFRGEICSQAE